MASVILPQNSSPDDFFVLRHYLYGFFIPHQHPNAAFAHSMPHELDAEVLADGLGGGATALGRWGKTA